MGKTTDSTVIRSLRQPGAYPHPVSDVEIIETHISWVLLAGEFAYKIKKPLDLGFLDFRDLARRRFYCEEEIRLNKPWAPTIYLTVVPITLSEGQARIDGEGTAVEYAVKMRRFDPASCLDVQLAENKLSVADMRELANMLAKRHSGATVVAPALRASTVSRAIGLIHENFEPLKNAIELTLFDELRRWTMKQLDDLQECLWQRFDDGYFRECHGDLHLRNIVRLPEGLTMFDGIEFSNELRHTDVMADVAFLIMDLVANQRQSLAAHCINRYLEVTGDYDGMRVFNLYFAYRCLVRAKIAVIRSEERRDENERIRDQEEAQRYCEMAQHQIRSRTPTLITMTGMSGSGKTWVSGQLMAAFPAIRIRSDTERKRLFGLGETASSNSELDAGVYSDDVSADLYSRLNTLAAVLLLAGHDVILDATFLHAAQRAAALAVAQRCGAHFALLETVAASRVLRARLRARKEQRDDASEADTTVLQQQMRSAEPLTDEERRWTVSCESADIDAAQLVRTIRRVAESR